MKIACPVPDYDGTDEDGQPRYWVERPDEWLGKHSETADEAMDKGRSLGITHDLYLTFAVSMALLDDWRLPGMEGKLSADKVAELPLGIIAWVNYVGYGSYAESFRVKKKSSEQLQMLSRAAQARAAGTLQETT